MSWDEYFTQTEKRPPRPLHLKAIQILGEYGLKSGSAIDLGCGVGNEARHLLENGWHVLAIDKEEGAILRIKAFSDGNLKTMQSDFESLKTLPAVDLICAYHSLPFCPATHFENVLELIKSSINEKGFLVASFFGMEDDWVKSGNNVGVTVDNLKKSFSSFDILHIDEKKGYRSSILDGWKNWHVIEVIARKR